MALHRTGRVACPSFSLRVQRVKRSRFSHNDRITFNLRWDLVLKRLRAYGRQDQDAGFTFRHADGSALDAGDGHPFVCVLLLDLFDGLLRHGLPSCQGRWGQCNKRTRQERPPRPIHPPSTGPLSVRQTMDGSLFLKPLLQPCDNNSRFPCR